VPLAHKISTSDEDRTTTDDDPVIDAVLASRRRAVVHGGPAREGLHLVPIDNRAAARAAGRIVFERASRPAILGFPLDRTRVAEVVAGFDPTRVPFPATRERLLGLRDAADDVGLDWRAVPISICTVNDRRSGQAGAMRLLGRDTVPDAVVAMSDELAAGALDAAAESGLAVPDALTVSGWDDGATVAARARFVLRPYRCRGSVAARDGRVASRRARDDAAVRARAHFPPGGTCLSASIPLARCIGATADGRNHRLLADWRQCKQNAFMGVQITIRDVEEVVRDELAARAARRGQSMQEYLRGTLEALVAKPAPEDWLHGVRQRKALSGARVPGDDIIEERDRDRR